MRQNITYNQNIIDIWMKGKRPLLVCGHSFEMLEVRKHFSDVVRFQDFTPNPTYESVVAGVKTYRENRCNAIVAVGGGSAIDVAKCIKLFSNMDGKRNYLEQEIVANDIPFLTIPTTAGTGSEATRFAVIYFKGEKQSVMHVSCLPDTVVFIPSVLEKLPLYQKKATLLDAFCHAIESYWSVNSTDESKGYAKEAIQLILANMEKYLSGENNPKIYCQMLTASNLAGKAINITQTTAGHAMSYKLTSLYGISHGHAVALCVSKLWPYMIEHIDQCIDPRGTGYLTGVFDEIADIMECKSSLEVADRFQDILQSFELEIPRVREGDYPILVSSVNQDRVKNNPIKLACEDMECLYHEILGKQS